MTIFNVFVGVKVLVFSDPHVMNENLLDREGKAWTDYLEADSARKRKTGLPMTSLEEW